MEAWDREWAAFGRDELMQDWAGWNLVHVSASFFCFLFLFSYIYIYNLIKIYIQIEFLTPI
jgi:hypothetical protein